MGSINGLAARTDERINGLALCAGIGGIELGLRDAIGRDYQTVCYVEREIYCASVLAARMRDGSLCAAPIWSDLTAFDPEPWRGIVDLISAGYPCQPFSQAGKRTGTADPRHMWPHVLRCVDAIRPRLVFLENVTGHITLGLEQVRDDLLGLGYSVEAGIFSAAEVGAPHIRKRIFILADAASLRRISCRSDGMGVDEEEKSRPFTRESGQAHPWQIEPDVGRVANEFPHRASALRALGNAVVPACASHAFRHLLRASTTRHAIASGA